MNNKIREFEKASKLEIFGLGARRDKWEAALEKYAELIVEDIMENLSFHGHEDAVSQVQWHAANKYGVKK